MMNIRLNLLSPFKKERVKHLITYLFTKEILEIVILTASILAITHLLGWLVLTEQLSELGKTAFLISREYPAHDQEIKSVNATLRSMANAAEKYNRITPRLRDITETLPPQIKINTLTLDEKEHRLIMKATALTREDLLEYIEAVRKISWVQSVENPTAQLFQKENINFEVNAVIKK